MLKSKNFLRNARRAFLRGGKREGSSAKEGPSRYHLASIPAGLAKFLVLCCGRQTTEAMSGMAQALPTGAGPFERPILRHLFLQNFSLL